jgi:hypothetical protein
MRLAGEALEDTSKTTKEANAAIKRAYENPHHGFSMEDVAEGVAFLSSTDDGTNTPLNYGSLS